MAGTATPGVRPAERGTADVRRLLLVGATADAVVGDLPDGVFAVRRVRDTAQAADIVARDGADVVVTTIGDALRWVEPEAAGGARAVPLIAVRDAAEPLDLRVAEAAGIDRVITLPRERTALADVLAVARRSSTSADAGGDLPLDALRSSLVDRFAELEQTHERLRLLVDRLREEALRRRAMEAVLRGEERRQVEIVDSLRELDAMKRSMTAAIASECVEPARGVFERLRSLGRLSRDLGPAQRSLLDIAVRNARRLRVLVDDLCFAATVQSGLLRTGSTHCSILSIVAAACAFEAESVAERGLVLRVDVPESLPPVAVDIDAVTRGMSAVMSNAVKFSPRGGAVDVHARREGDVVRVDVADDGPGIPDDEQTAVFELFHRARPAVAAEAPGSGIGLYVARHVVRAHGGELTLRSTAGAGTTVTVRLPVADPDDGGRG